MLPADSEVRGMALNLIKEILSARGEFTATDRERLERVEKIFIAGANSDSFRKVVVALPPVRDEVRVKAY
jgi:hypothetical protein